MAECRRCGAGVRAGARFCASCGAPVSTSASVSLVDVEGVDQGGVWDVAATTDPPVEPQAGRARPWRRWYAATAVALLAVVGVVAVTGGSDGGDETADPAPTTTVAPNPTTTRPERPTTTSTRDPESSTTEAPAVFVGPDDVERPALSPDGPTGLTVVVKGDGARAAAVDLDTGIVTDIDLPDRIDTLNAVGDTLVAWSYTDNSAYLLTPSGFVEVPGVAPDPTPFAGIGPPGFGAVADGSIWMVPGDRYSGAAYQAQLIDPTTLQVRATIEVPAGAVVVGTTDLGLVARAAGGMYLIGVDSSPQRLSTGSSLFYSETLAHRWFVLDECDERLRCSRVVWDAQTGERRPTEMAVNANQFVSVAPGGHHVVTIDYTTGNPLLAVYDVELGTTTEIPTGCCFSTPIAWSPDGRWLAAPTFGPSSGVVVIDMTTGVSTAIEADALRNITAVALMPTVAAAPLLSGAGVG